VSQTLFDERVRNGYAVARHQSAAQERQSEAAARRLAAEVQTAWLEWAASRRVVGILESTLKLLAENERVTVRQVSAGTATPDAVFRAQADRSDVAQQLAEAEETVAAAGRAFNRLLGRSLDTAVDAIADSLLCFELTMSEDSAVALALTRRAELQQVRASERAANAAVRVATGSLLPSVAVALDYGFQGNELGFTGDSDFWVASLVLSWNVFDGGRGLAVRQQARADVERAGAAVREVEDAVRADVRNAWRSARVAQQAVQTADERLQAARRTFDLVRRRHDEGLASHIEFVDARTSLTSAELNRTLTEYRYFIRWVDFERAAALRVID
jgi:outer membrane protein TolC